LSKLRLFIRSYKQGSRIASVPLRRLVVLSKRYKREWYLEKADEGWWLVLETS